MNPAQKVLLALLFLGGIATAQSPDLKKGWDAFKQNKRKEAVEAFGKVVKADKSCGEECQEALLGQALSYSIDETDEACAAAFERFVAASSNPYPYLFAGWYSNSLLPTESKQTEKIWRKLVEDPKAHGTLRAMAAERLGNMQYEKNDIKAAIKEKAFIGAIGKWQLAGTFDNVSGNGFDKDHGPLANPAASAKFTNYVGQPVSWFEMVTDGFQPWNRLGYFFSSDNSIMYAQTFVNSPSEQEVIFALGVSGSVKAWVNDVLVVSEADEHNNGFDSYNTKVKLSKGWNRILLQIGESEVSSSNFCVRLVDDKFMPIQGLEVNSASQTYTKGKPYTAEKIPAFAEVYFEKLVNEGKNPFLNNIFLTETYLLNDKQFEARKVLEKNKLIAPDNTKISYQFVDLYMRNDNRNGLTKEIEALREREPLSYTALYYKMEEAKDKEDYKEAETLNEQIEKLFPNEERYMREKFNLLAAQDKNEEFVKLIEEGYRKFPEEEFWANYMYVLYAKAYKDPAKATSTLQAFLKKKYSTSWAEKLLDNYLENAQTNKAINVLEEIIANNPQSLGYRYRLGDIYSGQRNYKYAKVQVESCQKQAPYVSKYIQELASLEESMGNMDKAKERLEYALKLNPNGFGIRRKLRELNGQKALWSFFPETNVYEVFKKAPAATAFPDDNSLILLDEMNRIVHPGGATEVRATLLVKMFNASGIEEWKEYSIYHNPYRQGLIIEKAEVLKANGQKVTAEENDGYVVFTGLEPGDGIHITYRLEEYSNAKLKGRWSDKFSFNSYYPSLKARYNLLVANNEQVATTLSNTTVAPATKTVEGFTYKSWEKSDMPAMRREPYMPYSGDILEILALSTIPDWNFVANWYADLAIIKQKADYEVKSVAETLFKDKNYPNELAKVKAIYDYIGKNISYSSVSFRQGSHVPQKASKTIVTKLGDCKDVSHAVRFRWPKKLGLDANLVLINTRDNGDRDMLLPSIEFNHCIAKVKADGKDYFVELTSDKLPFSSIGSTLNKAQSLVIPQDVQKSKGSQLQNLSSPNRPANKVVRYTNIKILGRELNFSRRSFKYGDFAADIRDSYRGEGKSEQEKSMVQGISSDFKNPLKLTNLNFQELETNADSVGFAYDFKVNGEIMDINGMSLVKLYWMDGINSLDFMAGDDRKFPYAMWRFVSADSEEERIELTIPEGKALVEIPKDVSLTFGGLTYSVTYQSQGNKLIANRKATFNQDMYEPSEFEKLREFFSKVAECDGRYIGYK